MIKKEYQKPAMQVVLLQHQAHLLSGSPLTETSTNLSTEDNLEISDTPAGPGFWGR